MDSESTDDRGTSGMRVVTRKYLFDHLMAENPPHLEDKLNILKEQLISGVGFTQDQKQTFNKNFSHFKSELKCRWTKSHNVKDVFLKYNSTWLEGTFEIPVVINRAGRPCKSFEELSMRSKRRKTEELRTNFDEEMIVCAAQISLNKTGKRNASNVLQDITTSPTRAKKYKRAYYCTKSSKNKTRNSALTVKEALQMFVDADLTRGQYESIRRIRKHMFPCYTQVQIEKRKCYPPPEACKITSTSAEASLQSLADLTISRFSEYLEEVLITLTEYECGTLMMIYKWGCDGSQQSQYKQKVDTDGVSDSALFQSCFVPLKLVCGKNQDKIVWQNPIPSSPRFCRPIRFRFVKESTDVTLDEINHVNTAVSSLIPTEVSIDGKKLSIKHKFVMTMVDGKVCNAATRTTSTRKCYICGKTSKDFNQLDNRKEVDFEAMEFGLSVLHARIRLFESIIHLSYKLPVKKYRERKTINEKDLEMQKKKEIQRRFRTETGLLIDMPKANYGNTNDGNTSRRFFENPELAADITGIDKNLIYRLKVILETISSGHKIDPMKFDQYASDTAHLYVELYPWHPMTPTMHKILVHGAEIIQNAMLPIGQLSEEAAEARNKHFRSYRLDFARKFSRESCNRDVFNRLLLSSDPLMSSLRRINRKKSLSFLPETLQMLLPEEPYLCSSGSEAENTAEDNIQ